MPNHRAWALTRAAVAAALFIWAFAIYVPSRLGMFHLAVDFSGWRALRLLGLLPLLAGAILVLSCIFDFAWTGRGTPAPFDPPRRLVVRGFYAYVRNPMYTGFGLGLFGGWVVFGIARWEALAYAATLAVSLHLLVRFYEEPVLRQMFGADYEEYCRNVQRWRPRARPWVPTTRESGERA